MAGSSKPPVLHHVNLKTIRLQEMIDWYGLVVGSRTYFQFEGGAWLSNDAANHRIAFLSAPAIGDDPDKLLHAGLHHIAFEYESLDDLLDNFDRLQGAGVTPHMMLDHGMTMSFYYVDPDGNSVELQADNFGDWAASTAWMRTSPEFAANPIGMPVDPNLMLEARREGASPETIHRRAYAGEFRPSKPMETRLPFDLPA
jgi:catechol-2,3-dioxygenase